MRECSPRNPGFPGITGKVKETVGDHKNDEDLKAEGQRDQTAASAKKAGENVKDAFK